MKVHNSFLPILVICVNLSVHSTAATSQFWNVGGTGGDGIWGTGPGEKNWNPVAGAPAGNITWPDTGNEVAVFHDFPGGMVIVFDQVQAAGISQTGGNYTFNAGVITLVQDAGAANPFMNVQSGTLAVDSVLNGANGLLKTGGGNLLLTNANTYTGTTAVSAGSLTLSLNGSLASTTIDIASGANLLDQSGGLAASSVLSNAGILTIDAAETIASLANNAGTVNGTGILTVTGATAFNGGTLAIPLTLDGTGGGNFTNATIAGTFHGATALDGATVSGSIRGDTTSSGNVLVSGSIGGGSLDVIGGTLNLTGTSTNHLVTISAPASLVDSNGGLAANTILTNAGALTVNGADTVTGYVSNGGMLAAGPGTLTAATADLNNGSYIAGLLDSSVLTVNGAVSISGAAISGDVNIASGILTNSGMLDATTRLNITSGATLVAGGTQNFALLTTSGSGSGTWWGNLTNKTTVAPGAQGGLGALAVTGNLRNASTGVFHFDIATAGHDQMTVTGAVHFGGELRLNQLDAVAPLVPVQIVSAGSYDGNFTSLTENLDGTVWFNPGNGTVTRLDLPSGVTLPGTTANQTSTWVSLYDDVVDPDTTNITRDADGSLAITSGIADADNPDLSWALAAGFTPSGLDTALLNRLSPEVYSGFQDYAIQSTRSHQHTALAAPSLGRARRPADSKAGSKDALPVSAPSDWEFFAALDFFNVGTDNSLNEADYELDAVGFVTGARTMLTNRVRVAGYFAGNDGTLKGPLIDADAIGCSLGMVADALVEERTHTLVSAGLSYGTYSFDGHRDSVSATGAGWSPGLASFSNVDSDALELFIGARSLAWHTDRFRLIPSAGLRYVTGSMNDFVEKTGSTPGSPIALAVEENNYHAALAEVGIRVEADLTNELTLRGLLGCSVDLVGDAEVLRARFVKGERPMQAEAEGLSDDVLFLGLGAIYQFSDSIAVGLDWRTEFRPEADVQNGLSMISTFRF